MKWIHATLIVLLSFGAFAQRDLTPSSRKSAFGKRDLRNLNGYGLQVQLGATYLMSKLNNDVYEVTPGTPGAFRGNYLHDPKGKLGAFAEIGMFHFPKKRSKLSLKLKYVFVSYYDWGIGFKYFRGRENTQVNFTDVDGSILSSNNEYADFDFGHVYARFSIHKNIHFKTKNKREKSNFFLDNSLGINVDYKVVTKQKFSDGYASVPAVTFTNPGQRYSSPLHIQMHYGLGFGFRLKRGAYLIPGVRAPLLGFQMVQDAAPTNTVSGNSTFGDPQFRWFSSKYWPILIHVKYMFAFEKKNKNSCPAAETNDRDKETQRNR